MAPVLAARRILTMPEIEETDQLASPPTLEPEPPPLPAGDDQVDLEPAATAFEPSPPAPAPEVHPHATSRTDSAIDAAAISDAIAGLSTQIGRRLDALQTTFERELRAEATRERVVDRLHAELQDYKQDFLLKVQRPIFIDLIQLHDDVGKMLDARAKVESDPDRLAELRGVLEPIQTAIEDILYRQGVEPFAVDGLEFDPRRQRAVSTQVTDEPTLNKTVASRIRKGFCSGDKLIRPEIVSVFTFRAPA
jgi:molecular chaperone GrpE